MARAYIGALHTTGINSASTRQRCTLWLLCFHPIKNMFLPLAYDMFAQTCARCGCRNSLVRPKSIFARSRASFPPPRFQRTTNARHADVFAFSLTLTNYMTECTSSRALLELRSRAVVGCTFVPCTYLPCTGAADKMCKRRRVRVFGFSAHRRRQTLLLVEPGGAGGVAGKAEVHRELALAVWLTTG